MRKTLACVILLMLAALLPLFGGAALADSITPLLPDAGPLYPAAAPAPAPVAPLRPLLEQASPISKETLLETSFSEYAPTVNMTFEELVGDDGYYKRPVGFPAGDTYRIIVDIQHQVVLVYAADAYGGYTVPVRYMLCSTGLNNSTPVGTFNMEDYRVRFGRFVNDGRCGQYWTQIRKRIYFHTMLYSQKNASTYLVDTYNKLGRLDSHGCVRLTVPDARWIYFNIAPGTQIEIRKGTAADAATAAIRSQLVLAEAPQKKVRLVKGGVPNTDNWSIADVPNEVKYVHGSQSG